MILTVLAVALLPVHVPVWAATTVYALVAGPGALDAMEAAEAAAAGLTVTVPERPAVAA